MYSTNLKDDRYFVDCLAVSAEITIEKFIVDTGAKYTCCNYLIIDSALRENLVSKNEVKFIGGLVQGEIVKFYKFPLRQFTIGNINMGEQFIWLTFDKRVTDIILGMDILKQIVIITNPYKQMIYFCKDGEDYQRNFVLKVE